MMHRFDPRRILMQYASHKGLPFWGLGHGKENQEEFSADGTTLRYKDHLTGRWVFMPIMIAYFKLGIEYKFELPYAIMSISGKKTIVETPLVGRVGTVKELISIDDYSISITAILVGDHGKYPMTEIGRMDDIWRVNEPVELISVFTDILFENNDKVVIKEIKYPSMQGVEDAQIVTIECVTDRPFVLYV